MVWKQLQVLLAAPGAPLTNFTDRVARQRFIFCTPKNHNFRICLPKKITTFFSIPKKHPLILFSQPKKSLVFFFRDPKKISSFIDPKKSLLPKILDPKNSLASPPPPPPIIKICEWGPWAGSRSLAQKFCNNQLFLLIFANLLRYNLSIQTR